MEKNGVNPLAKEIYLKRTTEEVSDVRGDYFRDQTAIVHSMPFRRLKNKTQVFFAPQNDHVCTRIEHVIHVATIAATICKGLNTHGWGLDVELAYAIGLGHDLGHAPFGHAGEDALNRILGGERSFMHEINGYRVIEHIANDGIGLNLTYAVKDGILCHNGESFEPSLEPATEENDLKNIRDRKFKPSSYEGCIVRFSDKVAYLGRDIEDAIIAGFIKHDDIPEVVRKELGNNNGEIINTLIVDIIESSKNENAIRFSPGKHEIMVKLKEFNYKEIYNHPRIQAYKSHGQNIIVKLFEYLSELYFKNGRNYEKYFTSSIKLDKQFGGYIQKMARFYINEEDIPEKIITDFVSGMTDLYALECMRQISLPSPINFD